MSFFTMPGPGPSRTGPFTMGTPPPGMALRIPNMTELSSSRSEAPAVPQAPQPEMSPLLRALIEGLMQPQMQAGMPTQDPYSQAATAFHSK